MIAELRIDQSMIAELALSQSTLSQLQGVGIDLVDVARFDEQLDLDGTTFGDVFRPTERSLATPTTPRDHHFAGRFAAKEAFIKAWSGARRGAPPVRTEVAFGDIEVINDAWGRPGIVLHGDVATAVNSSLGDVTTHVSISHDGDYAIAIVVLANHERTEESR